MTVGEAMERAEELRPGSRVAARTRQRWLCEVDGMAAGEIFPAQQRRQPGGRGRGHCVGQRSAG